MIRAKLVKESMGDILTPKSEDDIIKQFSNLSQKEKNKKLINASEDGQFYLIKYLIKVGADINTKNEFGYTPLMWASRYGYLDIIKLLIDNGAYIINIKNRYGETALKIAYNNDQTSVISLLLKKLRDIK